LLRLPGADVSCHSPEGVGAGRPARADENVDGGYQLHLDKTRLLYGIEILSFQESAANSSGPQGDVGFGGVWDRFMDHNIGQVEPSCRLQRPEDFGQHPVFVRAQVDDAVGGDHIH